MRETQLGAYINRLTVANNMLEGQLQRLHEFLDKVRGTVPSAGAVGQDITAQAPSTVLEMVGFQVNRAEEAHEKLLLQIDELGGIL